jgi:membrane-bound serine protease (ClpP class)
MTRKVLLIAYSVLLLTPLFSFILNSVAAQGDTAREARPADTVTGGEEKSIGRTERPLVYTMTLDGTIGAVAAERIDKILDRAERDNAELVVIKLNTPGGFTSWTWSICRRMMNAEVPVCMYVYPLGATAGSAGVYLVYSAHFAAMAPTSNIGAAHPVGSGGQQIDSVMNEKVTNDAVAKIRAAAERFGRNADWAEKAVRESVSITATEALEKHVINVIADDVPDLLRQLDGRETRLPSGTKKLDLANARTVEMEMTFIQQLRDLISRPDIVFILFSIGSLGIVLELYNPGAIFPGVVGAICLILAFYASQTLPINYAGVALIFLAIILWILEVKIVSHGLLFIGGLLSLFFGGLLLIDSPQPALRVSLSLLITVSIAAGLVVGVVLWLVVKAQRSRPFTGDSSLIGRTAEMKNDTFLFIEGALWKTESDEDLAKGDKVEIVDVKGLTLKVKKVT